MPASNVAGYNRQMRSGSLSIPASSSTAHQQHLPQMGGAHRFDGPRSPPNTLHVPCKFFRQGACQAGNACPFSHDIGAAQENICKYFAKGNCKFGPKCANIHVLPDGRRINYSKNGVTFGAAPISLGGRPANFHSTSALTNSFMRADAPFNQTYQYSGDDNNYRSLGRQPSLENGIPIIDTTYSQSGSAYGSPRDTDTRLEMGLSPVNKGLSVLDAPLPASFDSNGISNAARYPNGPFPASVPNQFGLDSPSPSLNYAKESRTSETLKLLHNSAFGSSDHLSPSAVPPASSSPPSQYLSSDEIKRAARHSSRYAKPRMLSSSMPKGVDRDWDPEFPFAEEDYVPENLKELLTPTEKARRGSLRCDSEVDIPSNHAVKFGSPIPTASPSSRWWGPRKDDETNGVRYGASPFGHVGSPLRNSVIGSDLNSTAAGTGRPGGVPSRRGTGSNESLSVLTQQLRHTRLDDGSASGGSSPRLRPNGGGRNIGSDREKAPDRHTSSGSISSARLASHPIDEEDENNFVFNMDEEDSLSMDSRATTRKSSGFSSWTYAGVVAGKGTNGASGIGATKREPGVIGR